MFIPYSTDAPVYHWPFATVGLIVVNVYVFFAMVAGEIANPQAWVLVYGESLTPVQWVSSMFMHGGLGHLAGNMAFLWVFGLVVEGKLGWWRFLLCYLGIGIVQSAGEQALMLVLDGDGGSLGASSAIYGILAIAAIWAPKNEVTFFYWLFFFLMGSVEIPILTLAAIYIGFDLVLALILGLNSSSWLHVGGVIVGVPVGIALLKLGIVDCEGWDIFHVMSGDYGAFKEKPDPEVEEAELAELRSKRDAESLEQAWKQVEFFLQHGNLEAVLDLQKKMRRVGNGLQLPRALLLRLIAGMHRERRWKESCPLMAEVLERFPEGSDAIKIKLAQICVVELGRPGKALDLLGELDLRSLSAAELELTEKIARRARWLRQQGEVELDTDAW